MTRPLILAWVLSVGSALRKSQAKTLAELVVAAVPTARATLANLGRAMPGPARPGRAQGRGGKRVRAAPSYQREGHDGWPAGDPSTSG